MQSRVIECNRCKKELPVTTDAKKVFCSSCKVSSSITSDKQSWLDQGMRQLMISFVSRMKNKVPDIASPSNSQSLNCKPSTTPTVKSSKRALLCGVSYKNSKHKLKGPINDVRKFRDLLIDSFKFPEECIRVLTEEEPDQKFTPTKVNIIDSLKWLVEGCNSGDSLVFYFSGHGVRQPEFNGDEGDGFDETICPVDFIKEGLILDNELNSIIVQRLKKGVKLHAIVDACHSGSILDLSYVYKEKEKKWVKTQPPDENKRGLGLAICISACEDDEMACDTSAFSRNTMNGALTYTLIEVAKRHSTGLTYGRLLDLMDEDIVKANQLGCFNSGIMRTMFHNTLIQDQEACTPKRCEISAVPCFLLLLREAKPVELDIGPSINCDIPSINLSSTSNPLLSSSEEFDVYTKQFEL